ncbi:MAG: hypothetical protein IKF29_20790 [Oceanobacillus sp.]|nr:hypothetical protein [Oceanobacillus sp.]
MFGLFDLLRLLMSVLIILPLSSVLRESGYYLAATILGAKEKKLIIGSGPVLFRLPTIEVRKYFFMYSWMEYEELNPSNRFWHGVIYAAPIINPLIAGLLINSLLAEGVLSSGVFWDTFLFYIFYYILFDLLPVYLPDGQPTNGRAIFDLIWHGERSDYMKKSEENTDIEEKTHENHEEGQGYTQAQEETMENRDRDQRERGDHTNPDDSDETEGNRNSEQGRTKPQEKTAENQKRD